MPGEGLTHGPPAEKNAGGRYHRCCRSTGIPCAVVLTLIRSLPGAPGCLATMIRAARQRRRERNTSIGVSGRCDFTSAIMPVVCAEKRVRHGCGHRILHPTFVTTRTSLCMGQDDADHTRFL